MKRPAFVFILVFFGGLSAFADEWSGSGYGDDMDIGSGFVGIEGGVLRILGNARNTADDPVLLYLNAGVSFTKSFNESAPDFEPLKIGPKLGLGVGGTKTAHDSELFYDLLLKTRYTFGSKGDDVRVFLDFGPGYITYQDASFELESGMGADYYFGTGSIGVNAQYKEFFWSSDLSRAVSFLGTLAYHF